MGKATFVVDGVTYEGVVRLLPNGEAQAMGDFRPVEKQDRSMATIEELAEIFQSSVRGDKAEEKPDALAGAVRSEALGSCLSQSTAYSAMIPIHHSRAVFWADAEKSDKILDPEWIDIGHVSVATAYHPKCGRVTFIIWPVVAPRGGSGGFAIKSYPSDELRWDRGCYSLMSSAKEEVRSLWDDFCKSHEKPSVLWTQVTDQILVGQCGGWQCAITPSCVRERPFSLKYWPIATPSDSIVTHHGSIELAKNAFVEKAHEKFPETC